VFEGHFRGAKEGVLNLQTVEEEPFRAYMHWLYTGGLGEQKDGEKDDEAKTREAQHKFIYYLTSLYVVADRLDTPGLRNQIIGAAIDFHEDDDFPRTTVLCEVFSVLPESSKLGQLLLEISAHRYDTEYAGQEDNELLYLARLPPRVLAQLFRASRAAAEEAAIEAEPYYIEDFCNFYHEHIDLEEKASCPRDRDNKFREGLKDMSLLEFWTVDAP